MPRGRIELPTQGFSGLCSTTELPWHTRYASNNIYMCNQIARDFSSLGEESLENALKIHTLQSFIRRNATKYLLLSLFILSMTKYELVLMLKVSVADTERKNFLDELEKKFKMLDKDEI